MSEELTEDTQNDEHIGRDPERALDVNSSAEELFDLDGDASRIRKSLAVWFGDPPWVALAVFVGLQLVFAGIVYVILTGVP